MSRRERSRSVGRQQPERSAFFGRQPIALKTSKKLPHNFQRTTSSGNLLTLSQTANLPSSTLVAPKTPLKSCLKQTNHVDAIVDRSKQFNRVDVVVDHSKQTNRVDAVVDHTHLLNQTVPKEILQNSPLLNIAGKCQVTSVFSPTEVFVRYELDKAKYETFKAELVDILNVLKKHPKRIEPFRKNLTPGTLCLFEDEQKVIINEYRHWSVQSKIEIHRVYVSAINDEDKCLVEMIDTGGFAKVDLNKLWPLLPVAFYENVVKKPRFAQKYALRFWSDNLPDEQLLEAQFVMKEVFRDKTFLYSARQDGENMLILLRLPDVEEDMSEVLKHLLFYGMSLRETLQILENVDWKNCGRPLGPDEMPKRIVPSIAKFRNGPAGKLQKLSSIENNSDRINGFQKVGHGFL